MDPPGRSAFARLAVLLGPCLFVMPAHADFSYPYCSSQNTASNQQAMYEQYMSNGWCTDHCKAQGTYAFAVISYQDCWCSDYIPTDQRDSGDCSTVCPGFGSEKCGNKDESLYVYVKMDGQPSGTVGGSKPTSSANVSPSSAAAAASSTTADAPPSSEATPPSPAPPSSTSTAAASTPDPQTVIQTVTATQEPTTVIPTQTQTQQPPSSTTHAPPQTTTSDESAPPPPQTSIIIKTQSGAVVTQTIVTTPTSAPIQQTRKSTSNTGAIVGGVVGGVAGVLALAGGIVFALWRRRQKQRQAEDPQTGVQRNTSTLSRSGLLRTEKEPRYPPPIMTNMNRRHSQNLDQHSISPVSGGSGRRNSRHLVDQRLNPSTAFLQFDNGSNLSIGSVDDSRDYHRPLNVRNPDPEA